MHLDGVEIKLPAEQTSELAGTGWSASKIAALRKTKEPLIFIGWEIGWATRSVHMR
jgi:hypothetical protein